MPASRSCPGRSVFQESMQLFAGIFVFAQRRTSEILHVSLACFYDKLGMTECTSAVTLERSSNFSFSGFILKFPRTSFLNVIKYFGNANFYVMKP